jgi:cyanophycin synthetase
MSGIPVAEQARVRTIDDAIRFAEKIGYPVVLKPEAEEQGRGVSSFLQTQLELTQTFEKLVEKYKGLIIERHYFGDGYRVYVLNNQVVRVRKLEAAHVLGDGSLSIDQLIERENSSDERNHLSASMKKITVDDEVEEMLQKQNVKLSDVPLAGTKVLLARTTNLSRGGRSTDFFDSLHPENRRLCEEATKTIGLYCSGVDLISTDASAPWQSNGAIICEINAQPQIGSVGKVAMHEQMIHDANIQAIPISLRITAHKKDVATRIFNKCEHRLKITLSFKHILELGCPVQYFNELEISEDVADDERKKIEHMLVSVQPELS